MVQSGIGTESYETNLLEAEEIKMIDRVVDDSNIRSSSILVVIMSFFFWLINGHN